MIKWIAVTEFIFGLKGFYNFKPSSEYIIFIM